MEAQVGRPARATLVLTLAATYFSYVFQFSNGTFSRSGIGDWVDPYFINLLMEHWYTSLVTFRDPSSLPIYFPIQGTLGWSHGLVLYAPFYVVFRPVTDPFQAWNAALFAVFVIGAGCLYLVLRRMGVRFVEALVLTAFFATSPNLINQKTGTFSQIFSVFLIPMIWIIAMNAERARGRRVRVALAALSALLLLLLFIQEIYTAAFLFLVTTLFAVGTIPWHDVAASIAQGARRAGAAFLSPAAPAGAPSVLWVVVACVGAVLAAAIANSPVELTRLGPWTFSARDPSRPLSVAVVAAAWYVWRRWRLGTRLLRMSESLGSTAAALSVAVRQTPASRWIAERRALFVAAGFGAVLGAAVFPYIYLESFLKFRSFPPEQLWGRLHKPDVLRWTGPLEIWQDLWVYDSGRPIYLFTAIACIAALPAFRSRARLRRFIAWGCIVSVLMLAIPLRFGDFSVWVRFFGWVPGLSVIRDPYRVIHIYELAAVVITGLVLSRTPSARLRQAVVGLVMLIIVVEWNTFVFRFNRPRAAFTSAVLAPIAIERSCRTFFVKDASDEYEARASNMWALYAIDSAFIAVQHGIPTMNGYSAWLPDNWGLQEPQQPWYMKGVDEWITRHRLENVCQLDIEARTMRPYKAGSQSSP